jgi:hypothetical protein
MDEQEFREAFQKARELLKTGELSTAKMLVGRFVHQVVLYADRIEIAFNFGLPIDPIDEKTPRDQPLTGNPAAVTGKRSYPELAIRAERERLCRLSICVELPLPEPYCL